MHERQRQTHTYGERSQRTNKRTHSNLPIRMTYEWVAEANVVATLFQIRDHTPDTFAEHSYSCYARNNVCVRADRLVCWCTRETKKRATTIRISIGQNRPAHTATEIQIRMRECVSIHSECVYWLCMRAPCVASSRFRARHKYHESIKWSRMYLNNLVFRNILHDILMSSVPSVVCTVTDCDGICKVFSVYTKSD